MLAGTWVSSAYVPPEPVLRRILNADASAAASVHVRESCDDETGVTLKPVTGVGNVVTGLSPNTAKALAVPTKTCPSAIVGTANFTPAPSRSRVPAWLLS